MPLAERTLAIVKPDATARPGVTGHILARVEEAGLRIVGLKKMRLSEEQARGFYAVHKARPFYGDLVKFMCSGPVVVGPVRDHHMLMVTAIGETVQRALELQHLASPGTTLLSASTMQRVRDVVEVVAWHPPSRPTTPTVPMAYTVRTVRPPPPAVPR